MSGEDRHFVNPYPDFAHQCSPLVLDPETKQLCKSFTEQNYQAVLKLLKTFERKLPEEIDWSDTSIYTGISGYALTYLHLYDVLGEEELFQKAATLVEKTLKILKGKRLSFLCGDAGPLALGAIIYDRKESASDFEFCIINLKKLRRDVLELNSPLPDELLYGRVGYLYALMLVKKKVSIDCIESELIRSVIVSILECGRAHPWTHRHRECPLMYEWHEKKYLGAAHGMCGIIMMLLQVKDRLTTTELRDLLRPTIDFLSSLTFPSGNLPSSLGSNNDRLVHWCHGAPGAIFMFALAYRVYNEEQYLTMARNCAKVVWSRGLLKKGFGLCHGTAGNAYALLYLYQTTRDPLYLYRAAQFASWCMESNKHPCRTPDRPLSLFEGLAGNLYFLADFLEPEKAKFPGYVL